MVARVSSLVLVLSLAVLSPPALGQGLGVNLGGVAVDVDVGGDAGSPGIEVGIDGAGISTGAGVGADIEAKVGDEVVLTQQEAVAAVSGRKAMPLDQVILLAQASTDGQIIDARLISLSGFLLYVFKVLQPDGDVSELYFYARSGQQVESN